MPTIDEGLLLRLYGSGKVLVLAEQNNGFILQSLLKILYRRRTCSAAGVDNILAINTLDADGRPRFIHSGTYEELIRVFGLSPAQIAAAIRRRLA
jgi:transketolase